MYVPDELFRYRMANSVDPDQAAFGLTLIDQVWLIEQLITPAF